MCRRIGAAIIAATFLTSVAASGQTRLSTRNLVTAQDLERAGFRFPAYMKTIDELFNYQRSVPYHEELQIDWIAVPGEQGPVPAEKLRQSRPDPHFTIKNRRRLVAGGVWDTRDAVFEGHLVCVAVDAKRQVRGLQVLRDSRMMIGESFGADGHPVGPAEVFVSPTAVLSLSLPTDDKIEQVVILRAEAEGADIELEEFATLKLKTAGLDAPLRFRTTIGQ